MPHDARATLDDKYDLERARIFLTGTQALVRLMLTQRALDRAAGLDTRGFVSGYRGSPLGGLDKEMWRERVRLTSEGIHFQPGVNEELAATAIAGTQQVGLFDGARHDGVFGIWYGKGPGVDRSGDAFKHGNNAGSAPHGGVLLLAGDDHAARSSTAAHQSEIAFMDALVPVLHPAGVAEVLSFGLMGIALSRFSGCWVGMKTIAETVECSAAIDLGQGIPLAPRFPEDSALPSEIRGIPRHIRWPDPPQEQEHRLLTVKLPAALAFARANRLDRVVLSSPRPRLGVVTVGKAHLDLIQALDRLGLGGEEGRARAAALGLAVYKVGMPWPLEPEGLAAFARDLNEILVVEEKRPLVEPQVKEILYPSGDGGDPARRPPRVVGKRDPRGRPLLPEAGELTPDLVARALARRLLALDPAPEGLPEGLAALAEQAGRADPGPASGSAPTPTPTPTPVPRRMPTYCAGCPHNTSTKVPEGSRALAGIGCHFMVTWMPERATRTFSQMGGEGAAWIGQAPFCADGHVFVNLGDGTYFHSGLLAIRAAVAAGVSITYKILFNDAVAMTGGQPVDGTLTVDAISRQVEAEGVARVVVVAEDYGRYPLGTRFGRRTRVVHRSAFESVQRALRETPGVTVLIYDQTCAAEKRRRRKRGLMPQPTERVVINPLVCEGCGDCGAVSNCVALTPVETAFGRKRAVDPAVCNADHTCLDGLCPSFAVVALPEGAEAVAKPVTAGAKEPPGDPPDPVLPDLAQPWSILITGIGGTGVVTLGALLGMAAHLEGKGATVLDQTGIAQKNGSVTSHVRLARCPQDLAAARLGPGEARAILACDALTAAAAAALATADPARTRAVVNSHPVMTMDFARDPEASWPEAAIHEALTGATRQAWFIDAGALAPRLTGEGMAANPFLLGYAWQQGLIPLSREALEQAITLNGVAVAATLAAFRWGRWAAADPARLPPGEGRAEEAAADPRPQAALDALIDHRARELVAYQGPALAARYRRTVADLRTAEAACLPRETTLTETVARALFKLMAYKDEYEVARLWTDGRALSTLAQEAGLEAATLRRRLSLVLAPPLLVRPDPATGRPRKWRLGPWVLPLLAVLARLKGLRGTPLDPFGRLPERRLQRRLVADYDRTLATLRAHLTPETHAQAVEIAGLPLSMRGYGRVLADSVAEAQAREARLLRRVSGDTAPVMDAPQGSGTEERPIG